MPAPTLSRAEAQARAALLRLRSYDVSLDLTDGHGAVGDQTFGSRTVITFDCRDVGASTFVDVMAESLAGATLNERPLDIGQCLHADRLRLDELAAHNVLEVAGRFAYSDDFEGIHRTVDPADGAVYLHSQTFMAAAQRVFACFDQPDLKAAFTFHITAPSGWRIVSNREAETMEPAAGDATTVHFATTRPLPTYIIAVIAGPYEYLRDAVEGPSGPIELGIYCTKAAAPHVDAAQTFALTKAGFDLYHRLFDYAYPFGKYDQIFTTEPGDGGMENAGAVALGAGFIFRSRVTDGERQQFAYVVLHELAHMWFGNLVTTRWWDDTWLNEAFATFAGFHSQVAATRWSDAWTRFAQEAKTLALEADQLPSTHPIAADVPDLHTALANFDNITYAKGASVLKQLVAYVGEPTFFEALRGYFRRHEYANAELSDLLAALEVASGRDLRTWAREWLQTSHVNTLRPDYTLDAEGRFATFAVQQSGPPDHPTLRSHRVAIGLYDDWAGRLERVHQVQLDVSGERTEVPALRGDRRPALVIVNDDDLTYAKLRFDAHSWSTLQSRIADLTDSLARSLSWAAAWDMTRDGELAASAFVDMVLGGIRAETEPSILTGLIANLDHAARWYVTPERTAAVRQRLADTAWAAMTALQDDWERQLIWARCFAGQAAATRHASRLSDLYAGDVTVDGLDLDFELRWTLLHALVARGLAGEEAIAAELAHDRSLAAEDHAAKARAMLPSADVKARVWTAVTGRDHPSMATRMAQVRGFWGDGQDTLLAPYVERYFDSLDNFWAVDGGGHIARLLTRGLFPRSIDATAADLADAWLARDDRPPTQRRIVAERRHELGRALRNRDLDAITT